MNSSCSSRLPGLLAIVLASTLLFSCGGASGPNNSGGPPAPGGGGSGGGGNGGGSAVTTVAIIVLENASYEETIGSSAMPFLNSLVPQGALATQYFASTHPSIGNYFMLTTGQIITNDTNFSSSVSDDNIVRRLTAAGKTWKGYFQSIPSQGYTGADFYPYIRHHNPFSFFTDVNQGSATAANNIVSLTQLAADESANSLPNFMYIMADDLHNGHDCPAGATAVCPRSDQLAAADNFLSATVPALLNTPAFKQNGLLLITFDESDKSDLRNGGGHIALLALGSHAKAGFQSSVTYQHQNTLSTLSNLLGVTAPGQAAGAATMSDLLQ